MAASAQKVRDAIDNAVKASTEIKPGNYVTVKVEKKGLFGKGAVVLTGRCTSEKDKAKIEEVAKSVAGDVSVESRLRVSTVS
jgi:osmotically-inducible protein OsmY